MRRITGPTIDVNTVACGKRPAPRAPPDMDDLVLELDAAYSASSISSTDQAAEPQDLTYVDTFLAGF